MKPFVPCRIPQAETDLLFQELTRKWAAGDPTVREAFKMDSLADAQIVITAYLEDEVKSSLIFANDIYQVAVRRNADWIHVSIKRLDRAPIHDWRELQEIKNQILGPEQEAVELYPAESRLVDSANQYHLWSPADPHHRIFPFGFQTRMVGTSPIGKSVNRPFDVCPHPEKK